MFYGDIYPNEECYDEATAQGVASLMRARKAYAFGPLTDIFLHQNCIGFARAGTATKPGCVVVLSNASDACVALDEIVIFRLADRLASPRERCTIPANVGQVCIECIYVRAVLIVLRQRWAGVRFNGLLDSHEVIDIPATGVADFWCAPGKLQVWVPEGST